MNWRLTYVVVFFLCLALSQPANALTVELLNNTDRCTYKNGMDHCFSKYLICDNQTQLKKQDIRFIFRDMEQKYTTKNELGDKLDYEFEAEEKVDCYEVSITGWKNPFINIDNILCYGDICFYEYAWWNVSLGYRYECLANYTVAGVIACNGTSGIDGDVFWMFNATAATGKIYAYCSVQYCAGGQKAFGNETASIDWENDTSRTGVNPENIWDDDTVLVYHMNAVDSVDSTKYSNDGTSQGGMNSSDIVAGFYGNSINFDGTDEGISASHSASLNIIGYNITLMAWIYSKTSPVDTDGIIVKRQDATSNAQFSLYQEGDQDLVFRFYDGSWRSHRSVNPINLDEWVHVAATLGNDRAKIYINGVVDLDEAETNDMVSYSSSPLYIGRFYSGAFGFNGTIDEVRIYNTTLTDAEILDIYNAKDFNLGAEEIKPAVEFYNITLESPANGTITNDNTPDFSFRFNGTYPTASCELFVDGTGYGINATTVNDTSTTITANASITDGINLPWYVNCTNSTDTQQSDTTRYITIDTADPDMTVTSPVNGTTYTNTVGVDVSADETIDTWWYELDSSGTNVTFTPNITLTGLSEGNHNISICANDTAGNINCTAVIHFSIISRIKTVCDVEPVLEFVDGVIDIGWIFDCSPNTIDGNLHVTGNLTVDHIWASGIAHVFGLATENHTVASAGVWYNITMNQSHADAVHFSLSVDNITIIVPHYAHYTITFGMGYVDGAANPTSSIGMRVAVNGAELPGSYVEEDATKKNADGWLEHTTHSELDRGDLVQMQYIASATTVVITQEDTYATQGFAAFGYIQEIIGPVA